MVSVNEIYNRIKSEVDAEFADLHINFSSVFTPTPSRFPTLFISELETRGLDSSVALNGGDEAVELTFELQCYSNLASGANEQAKQITEFAVSRFRALGFSLSTSRIVENYANTSIKRRVARVTRVFGNEDALPTV